MLEKLLVVLVFFTAAFVVTLLVALFLNVFLIAQHHADKIRFQREFWTPRTD